MEEDSIDYQDEPEDDDEDPEEDDDEDLGEDPSEEHEPEDDDEDPKEDPSEEHEPKDEDTGEDKTAVTPPPPPRHRGARISVRPQTPMAASTQALINAFAAESPLFPLPPTSPAYDQVPLCHRAAMIRMRDDIPEEDMPPQMRFVLTAPLHGYDVAESSAAAAARPPRGQYDFVDTIGAVQGLIRSLGNDVWTITKAADRVEDVGYVRALQASEHRMMTSIKEVNLRVSYQAQVCRRESEDFYTQLLNAWTDRAALTWWNGHVRILGHDAAYAMTWGTLKKKLTDKYYPKGEIKKLEIELWNLKTEKVDKYISGLPDNIHRNVMSARPKTLNDAIELANDLMYQKLRTYVERQNDNKRKADDSSRNNQQPHKK
ncbi:hypothetical protein Tco_1462816, partial [Tanacetum coccineum]